MDYFRAEFWIFQVFVIVFLTLLLSWIQQPLLKGLITRLERTTTRWDDTLVKALRGPLAFLIWVIGIGLAAQIVGMEKQAVLFKAVAPIVKVGVIIAITWFLARFISLGEQHILQEKQQADVLFDRTTLDAVAKLLRASVYITGLLIILQVLGYSVSGILAFGGVGGIAVGFAARDLLANFFGGLMIYLDRPFDVGDWIRSPDREIEGVVEQIGWRLTRILTFDKRPLYIPNSAFANIAVENPSRMQNRRIKETIGIRYDDADKLHAIVADVKKMLKEHDEIDKNQTLIVNFDAFAPSSLDFFIYTFTKTSEWIRFHQVKQDVLLRIIDIIKSHGAECAFPTSTIHIADSGNRDDLANKSG